MFNLKEAQILANVDPNTMLRALDPFISAMNKIYIDLSGAMEVSPNSTQIKLVLRTIHAFTKLNYLINLANTSLTDAEIAEYTHLAEAINGE